MIIYNYFFDDKSLASFNKAKSGVYDIFFISYNFNEIPV